MLHARLQISSIYKNKNFPQTHARRISGRRCDENDDRPLGPTRRGHQTIPALLFPPNSPSAPRGAGVDMGSPDGWKPKSKRKRGIGDATGPFSAIQMKKRAAKSLIGGWRCSYSYNWLTQFHCLARPITFAANAVSRCRKFLYIVQGVLTRACVGNKVGPRAHVHVLWVFRF
jgi:hypothetical protein